MVNILLFNEFLPRHKHDSVQTRLFYQSNEPAKFHENHRNRFGDRIDCFFLTASPDFQLFEGPKFQNSDSSVHFSLFEFQFIAIPHAKVSIGYRRIWFYWKTKLPRAMWLIPLAESKHAKVNKNKWKVINTHDVPSSLLGLPDFCCLDHNQCLIVFIQIVVNSQWLKYVFCKL